MIGKMERVDLREVWKNEARDFTSWLFDNIDILGDELNVSITPIEKEKRVGSFSADILAESEEGDPILIENQLQKTDHDHLGKLLTYVSNLEAKKAIWISKEPRSEHERAIEWLNELTSDVDFYLVKIEAYKIGDSDPAPKFTVIAGPTESGKVVGSEKKELAERHKKRLEFWKILLEKSKNKTTLFSNISPSKDSWISTGAGKGGLVYVYNITYKYASVNFCIDRGKDLEEENKKIFDNLFNHKDEIEAIFEGKLTWQRLDDRRSSRICKIYNYAGLNDKEKWDKLQNEMIDDMIKLEKAFKKYISALKK
ncbi:hypothetical protein ES705_35653 [subsurface metagenome]